VEHVQWKNERGCVKPPKEVAMLTQRRGSMLGEIGLEQPEQPSLKTGMSGQVYIAQGWRGLE